jgi:hypothetical protein
MSFFTMIDTLSILVNNSFSLSTDGLNKHTHTHTKDIREKKLNVQSEIAKFNYIV